MMDLRKRQFAHSIAVLASIAMLLCACEPKQQHTAELAYPEGFVRCQQPRNQACPRHYRPVCAATPNEHAATLWQTAANDCTACAGPTVEGYIEGPCQQEKGYTP